MAAIVVWNWLELSKKGILPTPSNRRVAVTEDSTVHSEASIPGAPQNSQFDAEQFWMPFADVKIEWDQDIIKRVSIPDEIKNRNDQIVTVRAVTFLTKDGLTRTDDGGCKVHKSILLPPFGIIQCCNITPVPRFEWTIVVNSQNTPWTLTGDIPNEIPTIVTGRFRIATDDFNNGIFFIDDATVTPCSEEGLLGDENVCL